jgi:hypothetical protein
MRCRSGSRRARATRRPRDRPLPRVECEDRRVNAITAFRCAACGRVVALVLLIAWLASSCAAGNQSHTASFTDCLKDEGASVQTLVEREGMMFDKDLDVDGGLTATLDGEQALVMVLDSDQSARNFVPVSEPVEEARREVAPEDAGVVKRFGSVVVIADHDRSHLLDALEGCEADTD